MPLHERQRKDWDAKEEARKFQFMPLHERQPLYQAIPATYGSISIHAST